MVPRGMPPSSRTRRASCPCAMRVVNPLRCAPVARAAREICCGSVSRARSRATLGARAQNRAPTIFARAPEAKWIARPGMHPDSFGVFHARRVLDLGAKPARFVVHVSADNRYRLYVNGAQVSSGPQRSDAMHWRYETVDLAP